MSYHFVGIPDLGDIPHVMVDGMPRSNTALTLSHWPRTPTPPALQADLSAEVVLRALESPEHLPAGVEVVTIDHFDEDACASAALMAVDGLAAEHGPLLVEVARVGDFGVVNDRRAALVSFCLSSLVDAERTPVPELRPGRRPTDSLSVASLAVEWAIWNIADIVENIDRYEALWLDEACAYDRSVEAIESGTVVIEEVPDIDLAVVTVKGSEEGGGSGYRSPTAWRSSPVHPAAIHSATKRLRIATIAGNRFEARYRYETWVRMSKPPSHLRVDLSGAANDLSVTSGQEWVFDGASALTGALHMAGSEPSSSTPDSFVEVISEAFGRLDKAPPAWDPFV